MKSELLRFLRLEDLEVLLLGSIEQLAAELYFTKNSKKGHVNKNYLSGDIKEQPELPRLEGVRL